MVEQLARLIHHGDLAACTISRVEGEHARTVYRAGGQQPLEILCKDADGVGLRTNGQLCARLAFKRRSHKALVSVGNSGIEYGSEYALAARPSAAEPCRGCFGIDVYAHAEFTLAFASVDGQHAVIGDAPERLVIMVIGLVRRLFVFIGGFDHDVGGILRKSAQIGDIFGVFGNCFGDDVCGARECALGRVEPCVGVDVGCGGIECTALDGRLHDNHVRKRLKPCLAGLLRAGQALFAIGLVEVLDALQLGGGLDFGSEFGRELALRIDECDDVLLALLEIAQIGESLIECTQCDIVQIARGFFSITGDKRNGVSLVDKLDGRFDVGWLKVEFVSELAC